MAGGRARDDVDDLRPGAVGARRDPETGSVRRAMVVSGGAVRGRGARFWVRTSASLSMRGPSSAKPVSAAAASSTLVFAR